MPKSLSAIQGYGLAVLSVSAALAGMALLMRALQFDGMEVPLFLFAAALDVLVWRGRAGGWRSCSSCLSFDYFFVEPFYSFNISAFRSAVLHFFRIIRFAGHLVCSVRRRVEQELRGVPRRAQK